MTESTLKWGEKTLTLGEAAMQVINERRLWRFVRYRLESLLGLLCQDPDAIAVGYVVGSASEGVHRFSLSLETNEGRTMRVSTGKTSLVFKFDCANALVAPGVHFLVSRLGRDPYSHPAWPLLSLSIYGEDVIDYLDEGTNLKARLAFLRAATPIEMTELLVEEDER